MTIIHKLTRLFVLISTGINYFAHTPSREWFQTDVVLCVSLGTFLFFVVFALLMIGVKDQRDTLDSWHHGGWLEKIMTWCNLVGLMFFLFPMVLLVFMVSNGALEHYFGHYFSAYDKN